jgi:hypothetical protein
MRATDRESSKCCLPYTLVKSFYLRALKRSGTSKGELLQNFSIFQQLVASSEYLIVPPGLEYCDNNTAGSRRGYLPICWDRLKWNSPTHDGLHWHWDVQHIWLVRIRSAITLHETSQEC